MDLLACSISSLIWWPSHLLSGLWEPLLSSLQLNHANYPWWCKFCAAFTSPPTPLRSRQCSHILNDNLIKAANSSPGSLLWCREFSQNWSFFPGSKLLISTFSLINISQAQSSSYLTSVCGLKITTFNLYGNLISGQIAFNSDCAMNTDGPLVSSAVWLLFRRMSLSSQ